MISVTMDFMLLFGAAYCICYVLHSPVMAIVTPHNCTSGKVIGFVVVIVLVVVVDTNFSISQHQGTCSTCRRHIEVATGGKLAPTPSNQFITTGVCSICRLSDFSVGLPCFARNVK